MRENTDSTAPTFGIITALTEEHNPMLKLIDNTRKHTSDPTDPATYTLGTVPSSISGQPHHVVLVRLTRPGNIDAATAVANLLHAFPSLKYFIMVGTAAGIPKVADPARHVRLGDIVVPTKGVVEYDHIDDGPERLELRGPQYVPPTALAEAANLLKSAEHDGDRPWEAFIGQVQEKCPSRFDRPDASTDVVYTVDPESPLSNTRTRTPVVTGPISPKFTTA